MSDQVLEEGPSSSSNKKDTRRQKKKSVGEGVRKQGRSDRGSFAGSKENNKAIATLSRILSRGRAKVII